MNSLRFKAAIGMALVFLVLMTLFYQIISTMILAGFEEIEKAYTIHQVERAMQSIRQSQESLESIATSISHQHLHSEKDFPTSFMVDQRIDFVAVLQKDPDHTLVRSLELDKSGPPIDPDELRSVIQTHLEWTTVNREQTGGGVTFLVNRPVVVAFHRTKSHGHGKENTTMVGRFFTSAERNNLEGIVGENVTLDLKQKSHIRIQEVAHAVPSTLLADAEIIVAPPSPNTGSNYAIAGYAIFNDVFRQDGVVLQVFLTRALFQKAEESLQTVLCAIIACGIILAITTFIFVDRVLIGRLMHMTRQARKIRTTSDLALRVSDQGSDELSSLARSFNSMMESLESNEHTREARESRITKQNAQLAKLTHAQTLNGGNFKASLRLLTETAASTVDADSASIWLFNASGKQLVCQDLYEAQKSRHTEGFTLDTQHYRAYTMAMRTERLIAATEALEDPRISELKDVYLEPLGITSIVIAPVRLGGRVLGSVCVEHTGKTRQWHDDETIFTASIGDFFVTVLQAHNRVPTFQTPPAEPPPSGITRLRDSKEAPKILIVDDDSLVRSMLKEIIQSSYDCEITDVPSGEEAWDRLQQGSPDLCILDVNMDELSGLDLLQRMRDVDEMRDIPVVMCTTEKERPTVIQAAGLNADSYIVKPLQRNRVLQMVGKALGS